MSLYKRKEDGKWRVQISYKDKEGRYRHISRTARTRKEAVALEAALRSQMNGSTDPHTTLNAVAIAFLDRIRRTRRESTYFFYEKIVRINILPHLGDLPVIRIGVADIERWKSALDGKGLGLPYLKRIFKVLRQLFHFAEQEFSLRNREQGRASNFTEDPNSVHADPPLRYWTIEQFWRWEKAANEAIEKEREKGKNTQLLSHARLLVLVLFFAGMRKGEANALKVTDFHDGEYPFLSVTKSLCQKIRGKPYVITNPKNRSSVRDVPIPSLLAEELRRNVEALRRMPYYSEEWFLVGGPKPVADTTLEVFKDECERIAGIPHIRVHDLRHSYVSMLINAGTEVPVIASLVGHATPEITMRVYAHIFPKKRNAAVVTIDRMVEGRKKKGGQF